MTNNNLIRASFEKWHQAKYGEAKISNRMGLRYEGYQAAWQASQGDEVGLDDLHTRTIANLSDSYKHLNDKYQTALELEPKLKIATHALREIYCKTLDFTIEDIASKALSQIQQQEKK